MRGLAQDIVSFIFSKGENFIERDLVKTEGEFELKRKRRTNFKFSEVTKRVMFKGEKINFYPSNIKGKCYNTAVFVSLKASTLKFKADDKSIVPLDKILKKMVQQVLGSCFGANTNILLITDEINTSIIQEWIPNLKAMEKNCHKVSVYFVNSKEELKDVNYFFGLKNNSH